MNSSSTPHRGRSNDNLTMEGDRNGDEADVESEAFLGTARARDVEVKDSHRDGFLAGRNHLLLAMAASLSLALGWFGLHPNNSLDYLDEKVVSPLRNSSSWVLFNQSKEHANIYKQKQIANYKRGSGLLLNIHITHHAGTFVCAEMKKHGPVPDFNCMHPKNGIENSSWPEGLSTKYRPEGMDEMQHYVGLMRPYFHFVRLVLESRRSAPLITYFFFQTFRNFAKLGVLELGKP